MWFVQELRCAAMFVLFTSFDAPGRDSYWPRCSHESSTTCDSRNGGLYLFLGSMFRSSRSFSDSFLKGSNSKNLIFCLFGCCNMMNLPDVTDSRILPIGCRNEFAWSSFCTQTARDQTNCKDHITWAEGSKMRRHIKEFSNEAIRCSCVAF